MPRDIDRQSAAQRRSARLLTIMAGVIVVGAVAYFALTLIANRRTPVYPDTHYTGENGISVYYESGLWPVCQMTVEEVAVSAGEGDASGEETVQHTVLQLASSEDSDNSYYQVVMLERGDQSTYTDYLAQSEAALRADYGIAKSSKVKMEIEGATVTAKRYDIQAYYAVLATIEYDTGDVVYVSALTRLASISDIVNLVESVTLE